MYRITREWRSGTGYAFFIFHNETGEMVGGLTFANVRYGVVKSANIGYWTGVSHTRKGYMTEAIQIGLDFAFNELGLHRIEAACLLHNIPSRSLLLKSGFQPEGQARKYLCIAGRWQDHDTFGLLCSDITGFVPVIKKGSAK
jgi:ribosomal-protein-alanine N-acetyltransferase